jgi:hypothetical protein
MAIPQVVEIWDRDGENGRRAGGCEMMNLSIKTNDQLAESPPGYANPVPVISALWSD